MFIEENIEIALSPLRRVKALLHYATIYCYVTRGYKYTNNWKSHKLLQICKQVVTRLLSSRYQDVFALLVSSCCDKSGTSCYHISCYEVDDGNRLATSCSTKAVCNKLLRACCHQLVTCRREQTYWNNLLRVCWPHHPRYNLLNELDENNLFQTCQQLGTSNANTSCWQVVRFLRVQPRPPTSSISLVCI
jgi:hypothetical protein